MNSQSGFPGRVLSLLYLAVAMPMSAAPATAAIMPSLEELEHRARGSLAMRTLDAELAMATRRSQADLTSTAPRLYGAGGLASGDELLDPTRSRNYSRATSEVGLRLPLLGSRSQIVAANQRVTRSLQRREAEVELARRDIIRRVRLAYADYWTAQQTSLLSRKYLENEAAMTRVLRLRAGAGLLLDSERQQLLIGFEVARSEVTRSQVSEQQALRQLRLLVADELPAGPVIYPQLRMACASGSDAALAFDQDPEIRALTAELESVAPLASADRWRGVHSELRLGYQLAGESFGERNGGSAVLGWSFEMPLNPGQQRGRIAAAAESETNYLLLQRDLRRSELEVQFQSLNARRSEIRQSLQLASVRLAAAQQAIHERELRAVRLAGDVTEQLQASRLAHYSAARAGVDAHRSELLWFADWARFEPLACAREGSEPVPAPAAAPAPAPQFTATRRGLYLWTSAPWLSGSAIDVQAAMARLKALGIGTLMVSLDADQIEQQATDGSALQRLAQHAKAAGILTELLLGEPTWILPQHRARLLQIVERLRATPFSALHLDLEPNMLDDSPAGTARLLPELVKTLQAVKAVSPWPVACSLHPRYLTAATNGVTLGDELTRIGVAPTLMIYVANPQRVVEIARPIMTRYPRLEFRVALSVEHTLSRDESLFTFPEPERALRIAQVEQGLAGRNFQGVSLQPSLSSLAQWTALR